MDAKFLILVLVGLVAVEGSLVDDIAALTFTPKLQEKVGEVISYGILNHLRGVLEDLPPCALGDLLFGRECAAILETEMFPDLPNQVPLALIDSLSFSGPPGGNNSLLLVGEFHICDSLVTGVSAIMHELNATVTVIPFSNFGAILKYKVSGSPVFSGIHSIGAAILMELLHIQSFGAHELAINNGAVNITLDLSVDPDTPPGYMFRLDSVLIDINFDNIVIDAGEAYWFGQLVNWEAVSAELSDTLLELWPIARTFLSPILSRILTSEFVGNCGPQDILMENFPGCLVPEEETEDRLDEKIQELLALLADEGVTRNAKCLVEYVAPPPRSTEAPEDEDPNDDSSAPAQAQQVHFGLILATIAATLNYLN